MNDEISKKLIKEGLNTRFIGHKLIMRSSIPSTMLLAREEMSRGAPAGTAVIADEQTGGRGRLGRSWLSPPGSLALSIVLYPEKIHLPFMVMISALAVACAVEANTKLVTQLKWPNDVLIHGKKICGILVESGITGVSVDYAIIGIGLNVNMSMVDFPEISAIATSLSDQKGKEISMASITRELLAQFERWYMAVLTGEPVFQAWRKRLITLGENVSVRAGDNVYAGRAESVAHDGGLILRQPDGNLITIPAGDVTLRG